MWYRIKFRDEQDRLHMDIIEADNEYEAKVCGEVLTGGKTLEAVELVDETKFKSPLLSAVKPLSKKDQEWAKQVVSNYEAKKAAEGSNDG